MKRIVTILMLSFVCVLSAIGFAACSGDNIKHPHEIAEMEIIEREPTCSSVGLKYIYCSTCGEILKTVIVEKAPHDYEDIITPPTCTEQGYTTHTCKNCGGVLIDAYTQATGHSYKAEYVYDDNYHWNETTCGHTDAIIKQAHSLDNNGICTICGYDEHSTLALQYVKINGKEEYAVDELSDNSIKTVYIPDTYNNLPITKINENAFYQNTGIQKVIMSDNITEIGASAFYGCSALKNIRLSNNLTKISYHTFCNCELLNSITIPNSVKSIQQTAFDYHLAKLNYTGTIDEWCEINFNSGWHQTPYLEFYINNELVTEVNLTVATKINDSAFSGCNKITSVTIPDGVTYIGSGAFSRCNITSLSIPNSVISIGSGAFYACPCIVKNKGVNYIDKWIVGCDNSSITSVTIKEGTVGIAGGAFHSCTWLTSIIIPDSVKSIGDSAFFQCASLTSIIIPDSVINIGKDIFANDHYLSSIYYTGTMEAWNNILINSENYNLNRATRYYYSDTEPTEEGNYWHYDTDGVTPVIWVKEN
ncbi:MAG: leucine-rich repeat domain-containing protein [Christensenellaceae bacterium]